MDIDISMDIYGKSVDIDMDMDMDMNIDVTFHHIYGKPVFCFLSLCLSVC